LPKLPIDENLHLIWQEIGLCASGPHGPIPFSWTELDAFARLTGYAITPVEAGCLVDMSRAFCNAINDEDPLSVPPMERSL
jgi:hypothetical protein